MCRLQCVRWPSRLEHTLPSLPQVDLYEPSPLPCLNDRFTETSWKPSSSPRCAPAPRATIIQGQILRHGGNQSRKTLTGGKDTTAGEARIHASRSKNPLSNIHPMARREARCLLCRSSLPHNYLATELCETRPGGRLTLRTQCWVFCVVFNNDRPNPSASRVNY